MSEHYRVIIIGTGLSGLYCALKLQQNHQQVILLEARDRIGGRILSADFNGRYFDMGPAWIWPQLQPRLSQLLNELKLSYFKQYITGNMLYEKNLNQLEKYNSQSSHSQSYRITGGNHQLIEALHNKLQKSSIHLNTKVVKVNRNGLSINALRAGEACRYTADKIIFALPPRLIQQNIAFNPPLPEKTINNWNSVSTWMAGHCKILFIYDKPFWREQNLSGEVFSHYGPLSEIYDASPADNSFYALSSFVGLNVSQRKQISKEQLITSCLAQLQRLFGDESQKVKDIKIKDWSQDENTTAELDLSSPMQHPQYPDDEPRSFWNEKIILAGTEVAREHGGYLEGAIESADEAVSFF